MPPSKPKKTVKKKKSAVVPLIIPTDVKLPVICDSNHVGVLQHTIINNDMTSFLRLCDDYNYEGDLAKTDCNNSNLLHIAVKLNNKSFLLHLLNKNYGKNFININGNENRNVGGHTPLTLACSNNSSEFVKILLQYGADPNAKALSPIGETPLMICCRYGYIESAKNLIEYGGSNLIRDLKDNHGNTASFWAYKTNNSFMIKELNLPPAKASTPEEFLKILQNSIKNYVMPTIKKKIKKDKKGKGKGKGKK